jgi:hypothetical protein
LQSLNVDYRVFHVLKAPSVLCKSFN